MRPGEDLWYELVDGLNRMGNALTIRTGRRCITRLCLDTETGLALGIAPGQSTKVQIATGAVELFCEPSKASSSVAFMECMARELDAAMAAADERDARFATMKFCPTEEEIAKHRKK